MAAFITDKEEVAPGVIIFRRSDVKHRNWYCRVKVPKVDRYKTISLKTADVTRARQEAGRRGIRVELQVENGDPVFNRPFRDVAKEYIRTQKERAATHQISAARIEKIQSICDGVLADYIGSQQVHLVGQESWDNYPAWRRANGAGRNARNGLREVPPDVARRIFEREQDAQAKARKARGLRPLERKQWQPPADGKPILLPLVSDATIRFEMSIFGAVMGYAIKKKYAPLTQRFDERPKLKVMRRDEFTPDEYRTLYNTGKSKDWQRKEGSTANSRWYRLVAYNFVLIMCNTGMRPSEAKNLRWRDISTTQDRDGRDLVVLFVQGKGKSRQLVAPASVGRFLERIREKSKATEPNDRVFTTIDGSPASSLYQALIEDLLNTADLRYGAHGVPRSTYSFRHTYATFRLSEGVDVYFLAEQMGTSVKMIQDHYGHVDTIRHADRVLQGIGDWSRSEPGDDEDAGDDDKEKKAAKGKKLKASDTKAKDAKARAAAKTRQDALPSKPH